RERRRVSEAASEPVSPAAGREIDVSHVLAMTLQVEAAISAGDWQQAADLEAQRRAALVDLLSRRGGEIEPSLRDALSGIVSRTHRMIGEAHHHRRALLMEASIVRTGRKAVDEYDRNSM